MSPMLRVIRPTVAVTGVMSLVLAWCVAVQAEEKTPPAVSSAVSSEVTPPATSPATLPATRPAPKPLSKNVIKGAAWLAANQLENGAWGQGDESANMGGGAALKGSPNVADTCMAIMALVRTGSTPVEGPQATNVRKGIEFVCAQIEDSEEKSLFITSLRNTRTQQKLGTYIDTFLAAQMLAEMKGKMGDAAGNKRVEAALAKAVKKIETNQNDKGQWANEGWAPAIAQAQASKALNAAAGSGVKVDEKVREKAETYAREQSKLSNDGKNNAGDAGVKLYGSAGNIAAMRASDTANQSMKADLQQIVSSPATSPAAKAEAQAKLERFAANSEDLAAAEKAVVKQMDDPNFIAGFGSNGGEEFLSYLNIGESLFQKGGEEWGKWDQKITGNLNKVQNEDGSWSGHHCITGRTFCSAASLMVLTIDRSPDALAGKIRTPGK